MRGILIFIRVTLSNSIRDKRKSRAKVVGGPLKIILFVFRMKVSNGN